MKHVSLSDHFTYGKIFHIVIGPVLMMIFSSFYSVVDGIFLSNYLYSFWLLYSRTVCKNDGFFKLDEY